MPKWTNKQPLEPKLLKTSKQKTHENLKTQARRGERETAINMRNKNDDDDR